jgi:glutamate-1-semialdehyde aminotransferase
MRALVGGTSAAAVANQAEALQRQAERAEQIRLAGTYGQNAKSAVAATQAAVQVLQGISQQLDSMERINAEMAQAIELHIAQQVADHEAARTARERGLEKFERRLTVGPATPKVDPLHW